MTTEKRKQANRANAKKSTGPKSARGKQAVRGNALTHGLSNPDGSLVILPTENPDEFEQLQERCRARFQPDGDIEDAVVVRIAETLWRLGRVSRIESGVLGHYYQQEQLRRAEADAEHHRLAEQRANQRAAQLHRGPENPELRKAYAQALETKDELLAQQTQQAATLGEAFLGDARDTDALSRLSRYETGLSKHLLRLTQLLQDLQDGRLPAETPRDEGRDEGIE